MKKKDLKEEIKQLKHLNRELEVKQFRLKEGFDKQMDRNAELTELCEARSAGLVKLREENKKLKKAFNDQIERNAKTSKMYVGSTERVLELSRESTVKSKVIKRQGDKIRNLTIDNAHMKSTLSLTLDRNMELETRLAEPKLDDFDGVVAQMCQQVSDRSNTNNGLEIGDCIIEISNEDQVFITSRHGDKIVTGVSVFEQMIEFIYFENFNQNNRG